METVRGKGDIMHYPAINRRFPELAALEQFSVDEANEIRSIAYQSLYRKLPTREKVFMDQLVKKLMSDKDMSKALLGTQGALEVIIAIAQAMVWLDWPNSRRGEKRRK